MGKEGEIREKILQMDLLEAVIIGQALYVRSLCIRLPAERKEKVHGRRSVLGVLDSRERQEGRLGEDEIQPRARLRAFSGP